MSIMIIRWLGCQLFIPTFFCAPLLYEWVSSQTDLYWRRQNFENAFFSSISLTRKHFWVAPPNTRRVRYTRKAYRRYDTFMMLLKYKIKICSKEKGLQPKNLSRWNDLCLSIYWAPKKRTRNTYPAADRPSSEPYIWKNFAVQRFWLKEWIFRFWSPLVRKGLYFLFGHCQTLDVRLLTSLPQT